jgi:hypothetical protein
MRSLRSPAGNTNDRFLGASGHEQHPRFLGDGYDEADWPRDDASIARHPNTPILTRSLQRNADGPATHESASEVAPGEVQDSYPHPKFDFEVRR